ncbi:MAG: hypothetical protein KC656_28290, partial [Myxococcales bacterium]|nr:hypothetical protein [Myxococcales bacterium]
MITLLSMVALARECEPRLIDPELARVENAFLGGDGKALRDANARLRRLMVCRPLEPARVGRYFRARALEDAWENRWDDAVDAFRASLAADPMAELPPALMGDTRLRLAWYRAEEQGLAWRPAGRGPVDGRELGVRPDAAWLTGRSRRKAPLAAVGGVLAGVAGGFAYAGYRNAQAYAAAQPTGDAEKPYLTRNVV